MTVCRRTERLRRVHEAKRDSILAELAITPEPARKPQPRTAIRQSLREEVRAR